MHLQARSDQPDDVRTLLSGSLLAFFSLTFALSWAVFIGIVVLAHSRAYGDSLLQVLALPGVFAPAIVALGLTWRAEGAAGVRALLRRIAQVNVGWRWYVFAAGYMVAIKLTVAVLHRLAAGVWPRFGTESLLVILPAILISTPMQAGEEIGWRGYALPRMAARWGLAGASVLLGVIWAAWHLPIFFIADADKFGQSFPVYLLQVTAISVAMAWLFAQTKGSLLLVMLMHAAINNTKDIVPSASPGADNPFTLQASLVAWLTVALLWICAAYFLIRMPKLEVRSPDAG